MAGAGTEVARAYVTIIPKSDGTSNNVINSIVGQFSKGGGDAGNTFSSAFGGAIGKIGKVIGAIGLTAGVVKFGKDSVAAGMEFDSAMSQVAATMGTTADQIGELRDFAKEMGSITAFSATESAEALNYMALAGYDAETSMAMLPNVLNLAAAGGMDLAAASDMVTDTQSALGLTTAETTALVDKMAAAASTTNTSVDQLGSALLTVGGTAKTLSGGTTEAAQALGLLADNGIKGAQGGTALRNILLSISDDKFSDTFGELGVAAYDAEGNMRSLKDVFGDMNTAMADMTVEEKTKLLSEAFNKVDLKSVNALLGTNAERWDEVALAIDDSQGAAQAMADTQLDNLQGDITIFQSALEGLHIAFSDLVTPALRGFVQVGTAGLSKLTSVFEGVLDFATSAKEGFVEAFESSGLSSALDGFRAAFDTLKQAISGVFAANSGPAVDAKAFGETIAGIAAKIVTALTSVISWIASNVVPTVSEIISAVIPMVQAAVTVLGVAFDAIKPVISAVFQVSLAIVTAAIGAIKKAFRGISSVVSTVKSVFGKVKEAISNPMQTARSLVSTAFNKIKATIHSVKETISSVKSTFAKIKEAITEPIEKAKEKVKGIMEKVKGFFPISIGNVMSNLKLPHFSITGKFSINPPSVPRLSVSWYAKGGIFEAPSIIGVGEAGREGVIPLEGGAMRPFAQAIAKEMDGSGSRIYVTLNASSAESPEQYAQRFARELKLQARMGAI